MMVKVVRVDGLAVALWGEPIPHEVTALSALIERVGDVMDLTEELLGPLHGESVSRYRRWISACEANR